MKKIFTTLLLFVFTLPALAQMSGTYNIGTGETYTTLKAACDAVMASGISGNVTFLITTHLSESTPTHLAMNTGGFSITFRPSADENRTITFTKATDNTASSGGFIIGLSSDNWASLVVTNNITIDGYAEGGSTRRLTIETSSSAFSAHTPIHVIGDVNNLTIKNCRLTVNQTTGTSAFGAVTMRVGSWSSTDYLVDNIVIDNCEITTNTPSGAGIFNSNTTSNGGVVPSGRPTGLEYKNNIITVKHRAISLNYAGTTSIYKNEIKVNNPASGAASWGIGGASAGLVTTNVYQNKITQLGTGNTAGAANGIRGIQASAGGTWNIYNNFITGFSTPSTGTTELIGIRSGSASNIYSNTIVMNNVSTTGNGTQPYSGIVTFTASCDIRNNIIINQEDDFAAYCIYGAPVANTCDYNNFYRTGTTNAKIGFATSARATLEDWQAGSAKDPHSKSVAVTFTSATDLSLSGGSIGDHNLVGTPLSSPYNVDIDGDTRNATYPYMGADEKTTLIYPLAMHTVTMSSSVNNATAFGNNAVLGTDGGATFYAHWDATYLYLGWSGGRTNYSSDMFYAAIDTDPEGTNGTSAAIDNVSFLSDSPNPDFYVVYENNSNYYGVPASEGNSFEVYNVSGGNWNWVSRTGGNDNASSKVTFDDNNGEVRLRVAWSTLGVTPSASTKLGLVMWNNNSNANYMWARVPSDNPSNGSTPKTLTHGIKFTSTGIGTNPSSSGANYWLPVELTSFTAVSKGTSVELNWKTATETNNAGFEVERRIGSQWSKVGFVEGAGSSSTPKEYRYSDVANANGSVGYRLKQIDRNGNFTYSNVVEVVISQVAENFTLGQNYPNPFNPATTINFTVPQTMHATVKVYDVAGREVATLFEGVAQSGQTYNVQFNASGLASGMYVYVLQTANNRVVKRMTLLK